MKSLLLFLTLLLASCETFQFPEGAGFVYSTNQICILGMTGEATEVCYRIKEKDAFIRYADGRTEKLKVTGGGVVGGKLVLMLESGGRVSVSRDGKVTVEPPPSVK